MQRWLGDFIFGTIIFALMIAGACAVAVALIELFIWAFQSYGQLAGFAVAVFVVAMVVAAMFASRDRSRDKVEW